MKKNFCLVFITFLLVFSACENESTNQNSLKEISELKHENINIKIGYSSEENFKDRYSKILEQEYPNLRYTIVPTSDLIRGIKGVEIWSEDNPTDILYVPANLMHDFVNNGQLLDLDNHNNNDYLDSYVPAVIESTRSVGNGKIYGLPPTFNGRAIIFNEELFDELTIEYPTDQMSWADLIRVAQRFPSNGLHVPSISEFELVWSIGETNGYDIYQDSPPQVFFDSDGWKETWELIIDSFQNNTISVGGNDLSSFLKGETGMLFIDYQTYESLLSHKPDFNWSVVTAPVNPLEPDVSQYTYIDGFFAIPSSTSNMEAAIDILHFFNSRNVARWEGEPFYIHGLTTQLNETPDPFIEAIYQLRPVFPDYSTPYELYMLAQEVATEIVDRAVPIEDALKDAQKKAELILQELQINSQ